MRGRISKKAAGRPKAQRRDSQGRFVAAKPSSGRYAAKGCKRNGSLFRRGGRPDGRPGKKATPYADRISVRVHDGEVRSNEVLEMYGGVLASNFNEKERKKILARGVDVTVKKMPDDTLAETVVDRDRFALCVSPNGLDEETLTHETIHMLQAYGGRTDEERTVFSAMSGSRNLNEAFVEAETICRVKDPRSGKGYYDYLNVRGKSVQKLKEEDKVVISSSKRVNCAAKVQDKFDQIHISGMRNDFDGETAKMTRKRLSFWRR